MSAIVNVWIEFCQEFNHFKIFITIIEFWKFVHSRNGSKVISERFGASLWYCRTDLIFQIYNVFIVIRTRIFYVYVINKKSAPRCYNVFSKNFDNYSNELRHRIDCVLRKSNHWKQIQKSYERSQISRLLDEYHLIVFEKEINQENNAHFRKFFSELLDIKQ